MAIDIFSEIVTWMLTAIYVLAAIVGIILFTFVIFQLLKISLKATTDYYSKIRNWNRFQYKSTKCLLQDNLTRRPSFLKFEKSKKYKRMMDNNDTILLPLEDDEFVNVPEQAYLTSKTKIWDNFV